MPFNLIQIIYRKYVDFNEISFRVKKKGAKNVDNILWDVMEMANCSFISKFIMHS